MIFKQISEWVKAQSHPELFQSLVTEFCSLGETDKISNHVIVGKRPAETDRVSVTGLAVVGLDEEGNVCSGLALLEEKQLPLLHQAIDTLSEFSEDPAQHRVAELARAAGLKAMTFIGGLTFCVNTVTGEPLVALWLSKAIPHERVAQCIVRLGIERRLRPTRQ